MAEAQAAAERGKLRARKQKQKARLARRKREAWMRMLKPGLGLAWRFLGPTAELALKACAKTLNVASPAQLRLSIDGFALCALRLLKDPADAAAAAEGDAGDAARAVVPPLPPAAQRAVERTGGCPPLPTGMGHDLRVRNTTCPSAARVHRRQHSTPPPLHHTARLT